MVEERLVGLFRIYLTRIDSLRLPLLHSSLPSLFLLGAPYGVCTWSHICYSHVKCEGLYTVIPEEFAEIPGNHVNSNADQSL